MWEGKAAGARQGSPGNREWLSWAAEETQDAPLLPAGGRGQAGDCLEAWTSRVRALLGTAGRAFQPGLSLGDDSYHFLSSS